MSDVMGILDRAESAILYTQALLTPSSLTDREGDWFKVSAMRADSSYQQLRLAIEELREIRALPQVGASLDRVENAILYTEATVSPGNAIGEKAGLVKVHAGRAGSSYRQMGLALKELRAARVMLKASDPKAGPGAP